MTPLHRTLAFAASLIAAILILTSLPLSAQARPSGSQSEWFQYVAQFNCGHDTSGGPVRVVPGFYATAVNLYNPNAEAVTLRKRLALTFPPEEQATGEVSGQIEDVVDPGTALQVDCGEIQNEFVFPNPPPATTHVQGFLVIESNKALHVEAVYTSSGVTGDVSIDTQRIAERKVIPRPLLSKVTICHFPPGNPGNRHTITIDASALSAHKAHGDTVGECDDNDDQGEDED
jgi:hypothetical protein